MVSITNDLYFTNIRITPTAVNAKVCKNWYLNIIKKLKKKKQTFYELQIYNLIINKYSDYPPFGYNVRRRIDFVEKNNKNNIYEDNIFNIAYDNMIKNIFNYLKEDNIVFLNIKESLILYYTKYFDIYIKHSNHLILSYDHIDKDIAIEYKEILLKYYNHIIE